MVTTLRPVSLLVQHLVRGVLPLLRHAPSSPHSDDNLVDFSRGFRVSFTRTFRKNFGIPSGPTALRFAIAQLYLDGTPSNDLHRGQNLNSRRSSGVGSATWCFAP